MDFLSYISIEIEIISDDYSIFCSFLCGLKFNMYFCHVVYSYDRMKRIINCKSYAVSNNIRICKGKSRC